MNKYQEALDRIKKFKYRINSWEYSLGEKVRKETDILQELVDTATPKKPSYRVPSIYGLQIKRPYCSYCSGLLLESDGYKHCPNCGQKLDWSEE